MQINVGRFDKIGRLALGIGLSWLVGILVRGLALLDSCLFLPLYLIFVRFIACLVSILALSKNNYLFLKQMASNQALIL